MRPLFRKKSHFSESEEQQEANPYNQKEYLDYDAMDEASKNPLLMLIQ